MQFIYDNLVATLVAMTLGLALVGQNAQNRQATIERQAVYHAKSQALGFGEWLEDDIVKLGARFGRARDRFETETETIGGAPYTREFEYYYHEATVSDSVVQRVEVRYELVEDDATRLVVEQGVTPDDDVTLQAYDLVRSTRTGRYNTKQKDWIGVDPTWAVTDEYRSPKGLRYFYIEPRDSDGQRVPDELSEEADYVRIEFVVMPTLFPLHRARLIPRAGLNWGTTIEIRPF